MSYNQAAPAAPDPSEQSPAHAKFSASFFASLLQSPFRQTLVSFSESYAAHAAAVATSCMLIAEAHGQPELPDAAETACGILGPQVSFVGDVGVECSAASRIVFTTTAVLSSQLMFARVDYTNVQILLCETELSDPYGELILKSAAEKRIALNVVPSVCREESSAKFLASEALDEDLIACILGMHPAVAESHRNTVVFMTNDDISIFFHENKRVLNKEFSVLHISPQMPTSQLLKVAKACQCGGMLVFACASCVFQCSMLDNVELTIDTSTDAPKRDSNGNLSAKDAACSAALHRASFAPRYVRVCGLESRLLASDHAARLYSDITNSEPGREGLIGHQLAATIAAMLVGCGTMAERDNENGGLVGEVVKCVESDRMPPISLNRSIIVALKVLASASPQSYKSESAHRKRLRQLAFSALSSTGEARATSEAAREQKLEQQFQMHLSTQPMLRAMKCTDIRMPPQSHVGYDDSYVLCALSHGVALSDLCSHPHLQSAIARLKVLAAVDELGITEKGALLCWLPMPPHLSAFVLHCANFNMLAEGLIAAAAILTGGPFWKHEARRSTALNTAVAAVVDAIKASNCVSEHSAMNAAQFGRMVVKLAPNFKDAVKEELRHEPGIVFVGVRGNQCVYFNESLCHGLDSASASTSHCVNTDFTACISIIASCIQCITANHSDKDIFNDFVNQWSHAHKIERKTFSAILKRLRCFTHHLNNLDLDQITGGVACRKFVDMLGLLQRHSKENGLMYPPLLHWSAEGFIQQRDTFESGMLQHLHLFSSKCFVLSAMGEFKASMLRQDGTYTFNLRPPIRFDQQDGSCFVWHCFGSLEEQDNMSMDFSICCKEPVSSDTVVVPVPAAVLGVMINRRCLPLHPACFITIRSCQEISIFGPCEALSSALHEVQSLVDCIVSNLISVPYVIPVNGETLSFGFRFFLGPGLAIDCVAPPSDSNILILSDVYDFACIGREKNLSLLDIENELVRVMAERLQSTRALVSLPVDFYFDSAFIARQSAYDTIEDKLSVEAKTAKQNIPSPTAYFVFSRASHAHSAHIVLTTQFSANAHLPVEADNTARQSETALRVTFAVSNFVAEEQDSAESTHNSKLLQPVQVGGRKLFPVNMICKNCSNWHTDCESSQPHPMLSSALCTHHVKRFSVAATHASKMKLGFFHHTGIQENSRESGHVGGQWSCCKQPFCDTIDVHGDGFLQQSVACKTAFLEYAKQVPFQANTKMFDFCWERHYFVSEAEQIKSSQHPMATSFERCLSMKKTHTCDAKAKSFMSHARFSSFEDLVPPDLKVGQDNRSLPNTPRSYCIAFVDAASKMAACGGANRMVAERHVSFTFGPLLQVIMQTQCGALFHTCFAASHCWG
jgi:hypothetical protein